MPTNTHILLEGILVGIALALPFAMLRPYWLRVLLSIGVPLGLYLSLVETMPAFRWHDRAGVGTVLGGLYAAHLTYAWRLGRGLSARSRATSQVETDADNLFIVARFHARAAQESAVAQAIEEVAAPTRAEPGCLDFRAFRATRDPALFFIHSRWRDEAAFDHHAELPHTVRFLATVQPLIDHSLDVARTRRVA